MIRAALAVISFALSAGPSPAATDPAQLCDAVAEVAAEEAGLPPEMLRALTRTETGRARGGRLTPWPWTVNMEGAGHWFDDRASALAYAQKHHARGATSFDVGCFQINYRWHNKAFGSVEAMFDPLENARYAARYLLELHAESGSWPTAVGHYHSRTPSRAKSYFARYARIKNRLRPATGDKTVIAQVAPIPAVTSQKAAKSRASRLANIPKPSPGAVSLLGFTRSAGLLTRAKPLFD